MPNKATSWRGICFYSEVTKRYGLKRRLAAESLVGLLLLGSGRLIRSVLPIGGSKKERLLGWRSRRAALTAGREDRASQAPMKAAPER